MRISKRVLSIVLSLLMAFTMMPFTAFAAEPYADLKNTTTAITFDNKQWYLIDYDDSTVTLLSKECVGKSAYNSSGSFVTYDNNPTVKEVVDTWYSSNITENSKTAVADNKAFILESINGINSDVLKCNPVGGTYSNLWWLCSQGTSDSRAKCVDGDVGYLDDRPASWEQSVRPALKLDLSKVEFNSETNTFALPTSAPAVPQATVEEITAPEGIKRAYKFTANAASPTDYDNYNADFEIYFNADIKAGEVTLWGKYGEYDWTPIEINEDVAKGQTIRLVDRFLGQKLTYAEIRDNVSPFYCGISTDNDTAINAIVKFKLYEVNAVTGQETGNSTSASETIGPSIPANPVPSAAVTEITAPQGVQRAFKFEAAADSPTVYDNYNADFVVYFTEDIKAGDVILWGKYGDYDWTPITIDRDIAAGETIRLVDEFLGQKLTYAEIRDNVSPFYCGITSHSSAAFNAKVQLKLFGVNDAGQETGTSVDAGYTFPYIAANPAPVATITEAEAPEGAAFAYKYEAPASASAIYDGYHADFVATFDRNIKAGEVVLFGKYGDYDWTPIVIDRDVAAGEEFRIIQETLGQDLTYAEIRDNVSPFYCGAGGYVLEDTTMDVKLVLYPVAGNTEIAEPIECGTVEDAPIAQSAPKAIVTPSEAPADAAFAYKFEAPAQNPTAYDAYKADFVVSFDRDVKAGEVTLWGKYGDYDWTPVVIDRDVAEGEEFRLVQEFLGQDLTYAEIRDGVSPFYCGAGGDVLADTNVSVQLKLYPASGEPVDASDEITDDIAEPLPQADVTDAVAPADVVEAFTFTTPHDATTVEDSKYKNYRCDFVVTFEKDIAAGDVILTGSYGDYGWVDMPAQDYEADTEYRLLSILGDSIDYETLCKDVSPFTCGYKGAAAEDTGMKVELRFYDVSTGQEVFAGTSAEVETTVPAAPAAAEDKYRITLSDQINLCVYVDKANVTALGLKYNKTPELEENNTPDEAEIKAAGEFPIADNDYLVVEVPLAPAQIRDVISIDVYNGATKLRTIETSVAAYCEDILSGAYDEAVTADQVALLRALAQSILDYGKAASDYFGYNTGAFEGYTIANPTAPAFPSLTASDTMSIVTGVRYVATTVPEIRLETNLTEEAAAKLTVSTEEGYPAKFATVDGPGGSKIVVIQIKDIKASELGFDITINVSGDKSGTIVYTPLAWAKIAATSGRTANETALGIAVANYYTAAYNYFNS